jgi:hypothetical protein
MLLEAPAIDGLVFDEAAHSYTLDGQPVPGVTKALKLISEYGWVDDAVLAEKADLGRMVHEVIELDCLGVLDVASLDPLLLPYYRGWRGFLATSGFTVLLSEGKVASRRYRYAGALDLFGELNAIRAVVDAKCVTTVMPSTGPQTAAYANALRECRPDLLPPTAPCRRYALQLRPPLQPGKACRWTLHPFTDDGYDLKLFLACLTVTHHLHRKGPRA